MTILAPPPLLANAPWAQLAWADLGLKEIGGGEHHPRIVQMHQVTTLKATTDEVAWCSSAMNLWVLEAGYEPTRSAAARSWATWAHGVTLDDPMYGCIAVYTRGDPSGWSGHVGIWLGRRGPNDVLLGGNQSDAVTIAPYDASRILAYVWPDRGGAANV